MVKNSAFVFIKPHANTETARKVVKEGLEAKGIKVRSSLPPPPCIRRTILRTAALQRDQQVAKHFQVTWNFASTVMCLLVLGLKPLRPSTAASHLH